MVIFEKLFICNFLLFASQTLISKCVYDGGDKARRQIIYAKRVGDFEKGYDAGKKFGRQLVYVKKDDDRTESGDKVSGQSGKGINWLDFDKRYPHIVERQLVGPYIKKDLQRKQRKKDSAKAMKLLKNLQALSRKSDQLVSICDKELEGNFNSEKPSWYLIFKKLRQLNVEFQESDSIAKAKQAMKQAANLVKNNWEAMREIQNARSSCMENVDLLDLAAVQNDMKENLKLFKKY